MNIGQLRSKCTKHEGTLTGAYDAFIHALNSELWYLVTKILHRCREQTDLMYGMFVYSTMVNVEQKIQTHKR